jgi:hypothetical protein
MNTLTHKWTYLNLHIILKVTFWVIYHCLFLLIFYAPHLTRQRNTYFYDTYEVVQSHKPFCKDSYEKLIRFLCRFRKMFCIQTFVVLHCFFSFVVSYRFPRALCGIMRTAATICIDSSFDFTLHVPLINSKHFRLDLAPINYCYDIYEPFKNCE